MNRKTKVVALLALIVVSAVTIGLNYSIALKSVGYRPATLRELSQVEQWKLFLYEESIRSDLSYREFRLLRSIVNCESNWRQFYKNGSVILSSGNIGLAQINKFAHEKTYTNLNLDPNDPYDNLRFMVFLYDRDGIRPWKQWSGHCWIPNPYQ